MGKATRWLRGLLGGKKESRDPNSISSYGSGGGGERREKKRWSFGKSGRDSGDVTSQVTSGASDYGWVSSFYSDSEKEQNKHAIAVAAATAAAADAAVAAAQAAVEVVRLTSHGRGMMFGGGRERYAAIKIQTVFRGYLAKKALRALKALVKLQALVRGYLVRKQAAATLHSMQALIRAQAAVRTQRARALPVKDQSRFYPEIRPRRSLERFDGTRSEHASSFHSRRLSASLDPAINGYDDSPKIVEIDPGRPKSRNRRTNSPMFDFTEQQQHPSEFHSSPLPCQIPARISIPNCRNFQEFDWSLTGDECRFSTAQSTPRFINSGGSVAGHMPATPAKSICGADGVFQRYQNLANHPNYMSNTQSFKAKVRAQSAPKQRPEPTGGPKKRLSLSEMVESRASLSGVRMQRSCSQVQETFSFKNAVVGKLDRFAEFGREDGRDYYLQKRW